MKSNELHVAYSPCPNDTYVFGAWSQGLISSSFSLKTSLEDIQTLNEMALAGEADVLKISAAFYPKVSQDYSLLDAGCALGWGVGPKVIAKSACQVEDLRGKKIALPGVHTTATYLAEEFLPEFEPLYVPYHCVEEFLEKGEVAAAVIIHETRFLFKKWGMVEIVDLGEVWEKKHALPLPLGVSVIRSSFGQEVKEEVKKSIRASLLYAKEHLDEMLPFILKESQTLDKEVALAHINTYVTKESFALSQKGKEALAMMEGRVAHSIFR